MIIKKFHQFVHLEKGPINTAIIDFLQGNIYHIGNDFIEKLSNREYGEIKDFVLSLEQEGLLINIEEKDWVPSISFELVEDDSFQLEIGHGVDINLVLEKFHGFNISKIILNTCELPACLPKSHIFECREVNPDDFNECIELTRRAGHLDIIKIDEQAYRFIKHYNRCWGKQIVIAADGKIKPCFHSTIILGDIIRDNMEDVVKKAREYWELTIDKVEKCNGCELRYVCFDCREIAFRECGNLLSPNPFCKYNPKG